MEIDLKYRQIISLVIHMDEALIYESNRACSAISESNA